MDRNTLIDRLFRRLEGIPRQGIWLLGVALSVLMVELLVAPIGYLIKGHVPIDYLFTGLVTAVVPAAELADRTEELAEQLASAAKGSSAAVKKLMLASFGSGLEEQMELEGRLIAACADSADGREGIEAFLTKRAPKFG